MMSSYSSTFNNERHEKKSNVASARKRKSNLEDEIVSKKFKGKEIKDACNRVEVNSPVVTKAKTIKKLRTSVSSKPKKLSLSTFSKNQPKAATKNEKNDSKKNLKSKNSNSNISSSAPLKDIFSKDKLSSEVEEYLANKEEISLVTAKNIIKLFEEDNTIPFIARYRNDLTGNLPPDKLRKIRTTYDYFLTVKTEAHKLIKKVSATTAPPLSFINSVCRAQTLEELDFLGAPYKKGSKKTLAEQAKQIGLEKPAKIILEGKNAVNLEEFVQSQTQGLEDVKKVKLGIQHIIADIISKNEEVLKLLKDIELSNKLVIQSKLKTDKKDEKEWTKYDLYKEFSQTIKSIKPHQVLAINRGESEKCLSVKIVIPDFLWIPIRMYCKKKWGKTGINYTLKEKIIDDSVEDAIKRLLGPLVVRCVRNKLRIEAEEEGIHTFGVNVKQLLLMQPCQGKVIMGIDPGFKNGCKVAVISHTGSLLDYDKFFLFQKKLAADKLINLVLKHSCSTIALGNGVGCRETEVFLCDLIKNKSFGSHDVSYTIVNEQGISIYSCSQIAKEEFPSLDPTNVSAISLARRLQNPLSELVKIEPKHLGVGLYQHDVSEKKLQAALDEIVSECVSFVGVDLNSASFYLLRRVAGLSDSKAKEILKYRSENCSFKTREDIKNVKGIKTKTFQQCAGFIRIIPATAKCKCSLNCPVKLNPLDETPVHPESYDSVIILLNKFGLKVEDLGSPEFISSIKRQMSHTTTEDLAELCKCSVLSMTFIMQTLTQEKNFDIRNLSPGSIFRKEIKKLEDLKQGQLLTGIVRNVVPFGAFVDVGVGSDGLIHISKMENQVLQINDQVVVTIIFVCVNKKRIELKLEKKVKQ